MTTNADAKTALKKAIKINCSDVEPCLKKVEYTIPFEAIKSERQVIANEIARYTAVPGFRKGKAPLSIITSRFKSNIEEELMKHFYMAAFEKMSEDEKMEIIAYAFPKEGLPKLNEGEDYAFSISFDVAPDIELPGYKGIEVASLEAEITDKEIQESLDYYKNLYAEYKTIDATAQKEDMLKVSYSSDFVPSETASANLKHQLKADETWIWLNEPEFIPGSIAALTGAEKDREYSFEAEYPADYREAELAGKKLKYTVKVSEVQRKVPVSSDELLCEKMKVENIDALKTQIKTNIQKQKELKNRSEMGASIFDKLSAAIKDFTIPPSVLASEIQKEMRGIANREVKSKDDIDKFKEKKEEYQKEAERTAKERMRRFFIFKKIAKLENIKVEENEVDNQIKGMSRYYGYKEGELRKLMESNGSIDDVHSDILMSKVTEFLIDNAKIQAKA